MRDVAFGQMLLHLSLLSASGFKSREVPNDIFVRPLALRSLRSQPSTSMGAEISEVAGMSWHWFSEHTENVLHVNQSADAISRLSLRGTLEHSFENSIFSHSAVGAVTIAVGAVLLGCVVILIMAGVTFMSVDAEVTDEAKLKIGCSVVCKTEAILSAVWVVSLNHFCMGYNAGIIAGALLHIPHDPDFSPMSSGSQGILVSSLLAGATFGALCCCASDIYGRRQALRLVAAVFVLGPAIMCASPNFLTLVVGRIIAGWSVGMTSGLINMYISEIVPASHRGKLGGCAPFCGTCGIIVAYMTSVLLGLLPYGAWRWQLGLAMVPAICFLFLQDACQETPRWLLANGLHTEAHVSVARLYPSLSDEDIRMWLEGVSKENALVETSRSQGYGAIIASHSRSFSLGIAINILQQLSGVNVVIYFGPSILQTAGFSTTGAMVGTLCISLAQLSATGALIEWVDRVGRRPVALLGTAGMVLGHMLLVASFSMLQFKGEESNFFAWVAIAGMLVFRTAFSLSLGPLPYIITSELFPQQVRAMGVGWSWTCNWASNFAVAFAFPLAVDFLTYPLGNKLAIAAIFSIFSVFSVLTLFFIYSVLPETNGLSLETASCTEVLSRQYTPQDEVYKIGHEDRMAPIDRK